jgi:hypothetical protein
VVEGQNDLILQISDRMKNISIVETNFFRKSDENVIDTNQPKETIQIRTYAST